MNWKVVQVDESGGMRSMLLDTNSCEADQQRHVQEDVGFSAADPNINCPNGMGAVHPR